MKESDLAYAAGLIDGEGTITLSKRRANAKTRTPIVSISSTTIELLEFMKTHFGGTISPQKTYQEHHLQSWVWKADYRRAIHVCSMLLPYLKVPEKRRRAKLLLEVYPSVTPRNGKYNPELLEAKQQFEREFLSS